MNANELADEIKTKLSDSETYYGNAERYLIKAEAKLRQQQVEIEALKKQGGIWEKETMNTRIKMSLYQAEIKELRKAQ